MLEEDGMRLAHTFSIGTPKYAAPEVFQSMSFGEEGQLAAIYTEKADVYSAALVIAYLLTGRRPKGRVTSDPRSRLEAEPARRRWPELAELLERMWAHEPDARPTAGECAAAVRQMTVKATGCGAAAGGGCVVQ